MGSFYLRGGSQDVVGKQQQASVSYHGEGIDDLSVYPADVCRGCNTADAAAVTALSHCRWNVYLYLY